MNDTTGSIKIAGIMRESIVDGPGIRFVVFSQGCPHGCVGCHNQSTHDFDGGYDCEISKIVAAIDKNPLLKGVTFSGGEPMCQPEAFLKLACLVKERNLDLLIFSGYTYEKLMEMSSENQAVRQLLHKADFLVDGRFVLSQKDLTLRFRGSRNQRYIDMNATRRVGQIVLAEEEYSNGSNVHIK